MEPQLDGGRFAVKRVIGDSFEVSADIFKDGHDLIKAQVRYRTVGDASCTAAVRSDADTVEKVIEEVAATRITERGATRGDDRVSEAAMEDRKREGYF